MVKEVKGQYNPKETETRIRQFWESQRIVNNLTKFSPKKKKFYLLDGPPYANEEAHVGNLKTTIMKDVWSKFKLMNGFSVWFQPGFDCHGLPTERMVQKKFGIKSKREIEEMGVDKFIETCRQYVEGNEKEWLELYKRVGAWRGYVEPYLTLENYYIESGWWTVKQFFEKGMLVRGEKPIYWCPDCETALAGYEVTDSYTEVKDPSIYVKFPLVGKRNEFIVIWTTTPWTLVSNVAIAVNPDEYYVKAKVGKEILIIAEKLVDSVIKDILKKDYEIVGKVIGKDLGGVKYKPALDVPTQRKLLKEDNAHRIVLSIPVMKGKTYKHGEAVKETFKDFVTMEEGTGAVHTAPGHGPEDYMVGQHYNLPMPSPINDDGKFTENAGEFAGMFVKDADKLIIERLEKSGALLHFDWAIHSYPLCWRCKSPLIFRMSKQWFLKVDTIKDKMLEENDDVNWLPGFGKERFRKWLEDAIDWCISQQRYWGIPLPIWICKNCEAVDVIGSVEELRERATKKLPKKFDLHRHVVDKIKISCKNCDGVMKRVPDTINVWFDSGISTWASIGYPFRNKELFESLWPADMICEAQDQIRGWFYSLMFCGVGVFNQKPYSAVSLMGWVLDEKGTKMSKSLGNVVLGKDAIEKVGSDIIRLYYCWEVAPWEVQNFSFKTAEEIKKALNILWNSYSFFTTYAGNDFKPKVGSLKKEDKWILSRLNSLIKDATKYYENFEFHSVGRSVIDFIVNDLSRFYIKLIRDRVWVSESGEDKMTALSILNSCLLTAVKLLSPITPFMSEEIYQNLDGRKKSIFMREWPKEREPMIDKKLEEQMEIAKKIIEVGLAARQLTGIKLRWPVSEILIQTKNEGVINTVSKLNNILLFMCNCKSIRTVEEKPEGEFSELDSKYGKIYVNKKFDEKLMEEALVREIVREIQEMRKKNKFQVKEMIKLTVNSDGKTNEIVKKQTEIVAKEVGAKEVAVGKIEGEFTSKLQFKNKTVEIGFDKI
jgi:isoleucyl-tRNA synthetase